MDDELVEIRHGIGDIHVHTQIRDTMGFECWLPVPGETIGTIVITQDANTILVSRRGFKQIVTVIGMNPEGEIQKYRAEVRP